ncbi:MAG: hypothetical protein U0231_09455 [Nitrospiraceae bacterium]
MQGWPFEYSIKAPPSGVLVGIDRDRDALDAARRDWRRLSLVRGCTTETLVT